MLHGKEGIKFAVGIKGINNVAFKMGRLSWFIRVECNMTNHKGLGMVHMCINPNTLQAEARRL